MHLAHLQNSFNSFFVKNERMYERDTANQQDDRNKDEKIYEFALCDVFPFFFYFYTQLALDLIKDVLSPNDGQQHGPCCVFSTVKRYLHSSF